MISIDFGICSEALLGSQYECGDIAVVEKYDNQCFIALVDVLGHGMAARKIALSAKSYLESNYRKALIDIMNGLHEHLKGTRGAVVAICNLDILTGEFTYVGMGNITVRVFGVKPTRLTPKDGIVGYRMTTPKQLRLKLYPEDIILMHSDGIREHFDIFECAGLLKENAEDIARGILKQFGKKNDDASCIVLKYLI